MIATSTVTIDQLVDLYEATGEAAPEWVLRRAGRISYTPEQLAERMVSAGVPEKYAVVEAAAPEMISRLEGRESLYLHGTCGDGKTTLAAALAKRWIAKGYGSFLWVSAIRLTSEISDTFGGNGLECEVVDRYASRSLLVLDDLGKARMSPWALSKLFWLIDERYSNMRPTIITSQYSPMALYHSMLSEGSENGDRQTAYAIASRIRETYVGVDCGPRDRRLA